MKSKCRVAIPCLVAFLMCLTGCGAKPSDPSVANGPTSVEDSHADHDHGAEPGVGETAGDADMEKLMTELVSFSDEDRASVLEQRMCPVGGEMLGSMGAPEKVDVNGQVVWICCSGCKDKLLADPETYLEKLAQAAASSAHPDGP